MSHNIIIRPINEPINPALINPMVGLPVETEIAKAFISAYEEQAQSLFDSYLDNAECFTTKAKVKNKIIIIVKITNKVLVLKLKFDEEKTLGINIKITNGLVIPPDK